MKNVGCVVALMVSAAAWASAPEITVTSTSQNASRRVTVNYTLAGEPGIVTPFVQTNRGDGVWIDIGDEHVTYMAGDVNKLVTVGEHAFTWRPDKSWPETKISDNSLRIGAKAWATNAPPDYMVVSLTAQKSVSFYTSAAAIPNGGVTNDLYKTEYLVMRKCPAANVRWRMGSPTTELGRTPARETPHEVTLGDDYYIGVYPVTQRQYQLLTGLRPSDFSLEADYATRPVEKVSYDDLRGTKADGFDWPNDGHAVKEDGFIGRLRTLSGVKGFDLPTDAQWEFACRAGSGAALYSGQELDNETTSSRLNPLGRYANNGGMMNGTPPALTCGADNGTAKVGSYEPNAWGLYDMLGNVWEWCLDWNQDSPLGFDVATGPSSGSARVYRGGSWYGAAYYCRCAARYSLVPSGQYYNVGFRLACPAEAK